jgi:hypothetical protein
MEMIKELREWCDSSQVVTLVMWWMTMSSTLYRLQSKRENKMIRIYAQIYVLEPFGCFVIPLHNSYFLNVCKSMIYKFCYHKLIQNEGDQMIKIIGP